MDPDKPQEVEHFHLGSFHFGEITLRPPVKLQMVNSIFINFCNEAVMFDRLQIFHQKKNII